MPDHVAPEQRPTGARPVPLTTIVREWGRIGCVGFGGPPAHIALLRKLCVADRQWLPPDDFEDGLAACNLLPGPASTQLAIFCAWRLRGPAGAILRRDLLHRPRTGHPSSGSRPSSWRPGRRHGSRVRRPDRARPCLRWPWPPRRA